MRSAAGCLKRFGKHLALSLCMNGALQILEHSGDPDLAQIPNETADERVLRMVDVLVRYFHELDLEKFFSGGDVFEKDARRGLAIDRVNKAIDFALDSVRYLENRLRNIKLQRDDGELEVALFHCQMTREKIGQSELVIRFHLQEQSSVDVLRVDLNEFRRRVIKGMMSASAPIRRVFKVGTMIADVLPGETLEGSLKIRVTLLDIAGKLKALERISDVEQQFERSMTILREMLCSPVAKILRPHDHDGLLRIQKVFSFAVEQKSKSEYSAAISGFSSFIEIFLVSLGQRGVLVEHDYKAKPGTFSPLGMGQLVNGL